MQHCNPRLVWPPHCTLPKTKKKKKNANRVFLLRVARKLIDSPVKRTNGKRKITPSGAKAQSFPSKRFKASEDDDPTSPVKTSCFYGEKKFRYVTPLERKEMREIMKAKSDRRSQDSAGENENTDTNHAEGQSKNSASNNSVKQDRGTNENTGTSASHTKGKSKKPASKGRAQKKSKTPLLEIVPGSVRSPARNVPTDNEEKQEDKNDKESPPSSGEKKFFKSRTPVVKKSGNPASGRNSASKSKMTPKGMKFLYKPASMKNKVTPASPDMKRLMRGLAESPMAVRRSPRKHPSTPEFPVRAASLMFGDQLSDSEEPDQASAASSESNVAEARPEMSPRKKAPADSPTSSALGSAELFSDMSSQTSKDSPSIRRKQAYGILTPSSISSCNDSVDLLSEVDSQTTAVSPGVR